MRNVVARTTTERLVAFMAGSASSSMTSIRSASRALHPPPLYRWIAQHPEPSSAASFSSAEVRTGRAPGAVRLGCSANTTMTSTLTVDLSRAARRLRPRHPPPPRQASLKPRVSARRLWLQAQPPTWAAQQLARPASHRARKATLNVAGTTMREVPAAKLASSAKPTVNSTRSACLMSQP